MPGILRRDIVLPTRDVTSSKVANRLPPALRLYPDVLEYIFLLGASLIADPFLRSSVVLSYAQICHDWRRVALSSKFLWLRLADFDFMPWPWNREMLRRSHPLSIVMGSYCCLPRDAETVEAELEYMERIRAYRLGFTRETWSILVENLQRPAEQMNSLSLAHVPQHPGPHSPKYHDQAANFVLPCTLFSSSAPHLRHLSLRGCFLDVQSALYTQLTSLNVLDIDTRYNTALTALEWLNLLSRMPQLRRLQLKDAIYAPESPFRRKREGVSWLSRSPFPPAQALSTLECLYLSGPMTEVAAFLSGTEIPPGCLIFIACRECRIGNELDHILKGSFRGLAQTINRNKSSFNCLSSKERSKSQTLPVLFYGNGSTLSMRVSHGVLQNFSGTIHKDSSLSRILSTSSIPDFTLSLDAPGACWQSVLSPLLATLCDHSSFYDSITSNITSLELVLPSPHPDLIPFFARTRGVKALVNLSGYFGAWLLEEMRSWVLRSRHGTGADSDVILPQLEALSFSDGGCLYGHRLRSLELFLTSRNPASVTVHDRSSLSLSYPSGPPKRNQDEDVCMIKRVLIRHSPPSEDTAHAMASLGVAMDCH